MCSLSHLWKGRVLSLETGFYLHPEHRLWQHTLGMPFVCLYFSGSSRSLNLNHSYGFCRQTPGVAGRRQILCPKRCSHTKNFQFCFIYLFIFLWVSLKIHLASVLPPTHSWSRFFPPQFGFRQNWGSGVSQFPKKLQRLPSRPSCSIFEENLLLPGAVSDLNWSSRMPDANKCQTQFLYWNVQNYAQSEALVTAKPYQDEFHTHFVMAFGGLNWRAKWRPGKN